MAKSIEERLSAFAEHIRTVHFTLLVACLALLAASLPRPIDELIKVRRDLIQIRTSMNSALVEKVLQEAAEAGEQENVLPKGKRTYGLLLKYSTAQVFLMPNWVNDGIESKSVPWIANKPKTPCSINTSPTKESLKFQVTFTSSPTLSEFIDFWGCLGNARTSVLAGVQRQTIDGRYLPFSRTAKLPWTHRPVIVEPITYAELDKYLSGPAYEVYGLALEQKSEKFVITAHSGSTRDPEELRLNTFEQDKPNRRFYGPPLPAVEIAVTQVDRDIKARQRLIAMLFPGAVDASFDQSFLGVEEWVGKRKGRAISILLEDLQQDIEKTTDSFEIMSVKLPISAIAKFGTFIVLCIQFYMALHLRRLIQLAKTHGALPAVAWIGLYPEWTARAAVIASAFILPVGISIQLSFKLQASFWTMSALALLYILVQLVFLTLLLRLFKFVNSLEDLVKTNELPTLSPPV